MQPFPPHPSGPMLSTRPNPTRKVLRVVLRLLLAAGFLVWQFGVAGPAQAKAGDLDPSFGRAGKVTTDFFGASDEAFALAVQDGKLVAAGSADRRFDTDFALARYRADGRLDRSFGRRGRVTTDFVDGLDQIRALIVQADGKLVAAGLANNRSGTTSDFALARYRPNGALDRSFGRDGKVTTDFGAGFDQAFALAVQGDGKLVAAGFAETGPSIQFALARYKPNGSLDRSFGRDGKVTTGFGGGFAVAFGLVIQTDGRLVAGGDARTGSGLTLDFALARYRPNGALDGSFGTGGKVTTDFGGTDDIATALAVQGDGRLVAAGFVDIRPGVDSDFALARYKPDGTLDRSFGTAGRVTTDFAGGLDQAFALAVQADGKLVAAGRAQITTTGLFDFALARYRPNGSLDGSFGTGGKVTTDFASSNDEANALVVQGGKLVAAGSAFTTVFNRDFALARYQTR
jgi:uncharacterized delta-60 repeat protein